MTELTAFSTPEIVRLLGSRFKQYRLRRNLTQREVSELVGLSLTTIHKFENGTARNISLSTFVALLKVIGRVDSLSDILPELPESPYLVRRGDAAAQRIRHPRK
jgi:transcriptional regulator with XRE-family HTH domain